MKRIFLFLVIALIATISVTAQTQKGVVKTRGKMINGQHVPGKGLPGAVVSIKGHNDVGVKNNNGSFSFPVEEKRFVVDSVKKKDYELVDADAAPKTYTSSNGHAVSYNGDSGAGHAGQVVIGTQDSPHTAAAVTGKRE